MRTRYLLFFVTWFSSSAAFAESGHDIMQKQFQMNAGYHDEKGTGKMLIQGQGGSATSRSFDYSSLEETTTYGRQALIRIVEPANLNGTMLLTHQNKTGDDDQWIYLPAMKKTNRIVGSAKKGSFIGSDFSYEDMSPKMLEDFQYTYLKEEPCGTTNCHVIDAIPVGKKSAYSKITFWVQEDGFQNARMDLYGDNGQVIKRCTFDDYRELNGKFFKPFKITMETTAKNTTSTLSVESLTLQNGLKDSNFTTNVLER